MISLFNNVRLQVEALNQHGYKAEAEELHTLVSKLEARAVNRLLGSMKPLPASLSLESLEAASK
jgi:hypothetical protein